MIIMNYFLLRNMMKKINLYHFCIEFITINSIQKMKNKIGFSIIIVLIILLAKNRKEPLSKKTFTIIKRPKYIKYKNQWTQIN